MNNDDDYYLLLPVFLVIFLVSLIFSLGIIGLALDSKSHKNNKVLETKQQEQCK